MEIPRIDRSSCGDASAQRVIPMTTSQDCGSGKARALWLGGGIHYRNPIEDHLLAECKLRGAASA